MKRLTTLKIAAAIAAVAAIGNALGQETPTDTPEAAARKLADSHFMLLKLSVDAAKKELTKLLRHPDSAQFFDVISYNFIGSGIGGACGWVTAKTDQGTYSDRVRFLGVKALKTGDEGHDLEWTGVDPAYRKEIIKKDLKVSPSEMHKLQQDFEGMWAQCRKDSRKQWHRTDAE